MPHIVTHLVNIENGKRFLLSSDNSAHVEEATEIKRNNKNTDNKGNDGNIWKYVMSSSCPFCPTDIVCRGNKCYTFQDYGSEVTSWVDDQWTVFHQTAEEFAVAHTTTLPLPPGASGYEVPVQTVQFGVHHKALSVYHLYEGIDEKAYVEKAAFERDYEEEVLLSE